jgi:hypothetical protein
MRGPADVDELLSEINDESFGVDHDYGSDSVGGSPEMFEIFSDADSVMAEPHTPPARRNAKGGRRQGQSVRKSMDIM